MNDNFSARAPHMVERSGDGAGIFCAALVMLAAYVALGVAIWWWV